MESAADVEDEADDTDPSFLTDRPPSPARAARDVTWRDAFLLQQADLERVQRQLAASEALAASRAEALSAAEAEGASQAEQLSAFQGLRQERDVLARKVELLTDRCAAGEVRLRRAEQLLEDAQAGQDALRRESAERWREAEVVRQAGLHTLAAAEEAIESAASTQQVEVVAAALQEEAARGEELQRRLATARDEHAAVLETVRHLSAQLREARAQAVHFRSLCESTVRNIASEARAYTPRPDWRRAAMGCPRVGACQTLFAEAGGDVDELDRWLDAQQALVDAEEPAPELEDPERLPSAVEVMQRAAARGQAQPDSAAGRFVQLELSSAAGEEALQLSAAMSGRAEGRGTEQRVKQLLQLLGAHSDRADALQQQVRLTAGSHARLQLQLQHAEARIHGLLTDAPSRAALPASASAAALGVLGVDSPLATAPRRRLVVTLSASQPFHAPLGAGRDTPEFLRGAARVRKRLLSRRDTEAVVQDLWEAKRAHDGRRGVLDMPLTTFLGQWLRARLGLQALVAEFGYNLLEALQRHQHAGSGSCLLTLLVLCGRAPEEAVYAQDTMVAELERLFAALDVLRGHVCVAVPAAHCTDATDILATVMRCRGAAHAHEAQQRGGTLTVDQGAPAAAPAAGEPAEDSADADADADAEEEPEQQSEEDTEEPARAPTPPSLPASPAPALGGQTPGAGPSRGRPVARRLPLWLLAYWLSAFFPQRSAEHVAALLRCVAHIFATAPETQTDYGKLLRHAKDGGLLALVRRQDADEEAGYVARLQGAVAAQLREMADEGLPGIRVLSEEDALAADPEAPGGAGDVIAPLPAIQAAWLRADPACAVHLVARELALACGTTGAGMGASVRAVMQSVSEGARSVRPQSWANGLHSRVLLWVQRRADELLWDTITDEGLDQTLLKQLLCPRNKDQSDAAGSRRAVKDADVDEHGVGLALSASAASGIKERSAHYGVAPLIVINVTK
jgi:hypothetical protein